MTAQRFVGFPALLFLAACASSGVIPRAELVPQNGPRARINASYTGGIVARRLRGSFSVDKNAYVMVGHLAGDGRIRILYPESGQASNRVQAKKVYSVNSVGAQYDGAPQLYSYASRAYRSVSARMDSYDGAGNGYLFVIASAYPLEMSELATDGVWDDYVVEDYSSSWDPRYSINQLAQTVTRGVPYTLDYADSFTTQTYSSYATEFADCSILSSVISGYMTSSSGMWGYAGFFMPSLRSSWGLRSGTGLSWYFTRPAMYYTHGYGSFGSMACDGYFGFGPRYNRMALLNSQEPRQQNTWTVTPVMVPSDSATTIEAIAPTLQWRTQGRSAPAGPAIGGRGTEKSVLPPTRIAGSPTRAANPTRSSGHRWGVEEMNRFGARTGSYVPSQPRAAAKPAQGSAGRTSSPDGMRSAPSMAPHNAPAVAPATRAASPAHAPAAPSTPSSAPTEIVRPPEF